MTNQTPLKYIVRPLQVFFFFLKEFQPMSSASDYSFLSLDQDTN